MTILQCFNVNAISFCEAAVILERFTIQKIQCVHHSIINQLPSIQKSHLRWGARGLTCLNVWRKKKIPKLKKRRHMKYPYIILKIYMAHYLLR